MSNPYIHTTAKSLRKAFWKAYPELEKHVVSTESKSAFNIYKKMAVSGKFISQRLYDKTEL